MSSSPLSLVNFFAWSKRCSFIGSYNRYEISPTITLISPNRNTKSRHLVKPTLSKQQRETMVNYVIVDARHPLKTTYSDGLYEPVFTHPPLNFLLKHMVWFGSWFLFYEPNRTINQYSYKSNGNFYRVTCFFFAFYFKNVFMYFSLMLLTLFYICLLQIYLKYKNPTRTFTE